MLKSLYDSMPPILAGLQIALEKTRAEGGDPKALVTSGPASEQFGGLAMLRGWCAANDLECVVSAWVPDDKVFFITPPDLSWQDPASAAWFDPWGLRWP